MLTSDLLRVRRDRGVLKPRYLGDKHKRRLLPVAEGMVNVLSERSGHRRDEVEAALDAVPCGARDRMVQQGLRKLLLDRCDFALADGRDPLEVRREIFFRAAAHRRALSAKEAFDRATVIREGAAALSREELGGEELGEEAPGGEALGADRPREITPEMVEARLFADLKGAETLASVRRLNGATLLDRYDVALAQGVLLRAVRVMVALDREAPGRVRQLFRAARFHGLMHRVRDLGDGKYLIELDGPFSLFSAVQKYGLRLAMFLPAVLRCARWRLRADIRWGKTRDECTFELGPEAGLKPHGRAITGVAPELHKLTEGFRKLDTPWQVRENDDIVALPGEVVCVPDLVFENTETGEEVLFEAFGFWSRDAVWQRVETIRRGGFPSRIILAAGKHLRVSEEVLTEGEAGELYVYKQAMRPRAILERLDARS
ncbi:MAG: DUF790 family protein [Myxococcota bacterium]